MKGVDYLDIICVKAIYTLISNEHSDHYTCTQVPKLKLDTRLLKNQITSPCCVCTMNMFALNSKSFTYIYSPIL